MRSLVLILLFALLAISQINTITDADLFCHFKTGEYILKNFNIPHIDIFSYTLENQPWIDHSWLFQVLTYLIFAKFGWLGVNILKAIVISLCFFILLLLLYSKYKKVTYSVFFTLLAVLAFGYRSFPRPEMFSCLLLCLFFYILEDERRSYLLPILQIIWVNMHGYFILGPILVFLYCIGELISGDKDKAKKLGVVFLITSLACFVNPYFYKGAFYPIKVSIDAFMSHKDYNQDIYELMMPGNSSFRNFVFFWVLAILSSITFLINLKKAKMQHALIFLGSFVAGYLAIRNMPVFIFLAMPLAVINLNEAKLTKDIVEKKYYTFFILIISAVIYFFISNKYYIFIKQFSRKTESKISGIIMPSNACDFLENNHLKGRIFNNINYGHYIAYRFYPEKRTFIDARTELYGGSFYKLYAMAQNYPGEWERIRNKYNFDIAFLRHLSSRSEGLIRYLYSKKEWALAYYDDSSAIFLYNSPENKEAIAGLRIDLSKKEISKQDENINIGAFFEKIGEPRLAEEVYVKLLESNPKFLQAGNNLAIIYMNTKRSNQALEVLDKFLKLYPGLAELYCNKGIAYLQTGREEEGFLMLEKSVNLDPYLRKASYMLGLIYLKRGDIEKATRQFIKCLNLDPYDARAHRILGDIYKQKGLLKKAAAEYNEADKLEGK